MIFDGVLAAAGDEDDVLDAGRDGLLDAVLDDRLVDERQHLLGLRLGGRQERVPRPAAGKTALRINATRSSSSSGRDTFHVLGTVPRFGVAGDSPQGMKCIPDP